MRIITYILKLIYKSFETVFLLICFANVWVFALTNGRTYNKISKIPPREVALVLGTSPKMRSGDANPYFTKRMDATALLYHHGKIKNIIVSGEKSKGYDEPAAMKQYLMYQEGIPERIIIEDTEGFNTHKSIVRCKDIFKKNNVIIVSQGFHNLRAIFFAQNKGMNAIGFDAEDVNKPQSYYRNQTREVLARVQAVIYYITGISPD